MDTKAYKRCEYIIRQFMSVDKPSPELRAQFHQWLLNERHCREKNVILQKLFYEALGDCEPEYFKEKERPERYSRKNVSQNVI